MLVSEQTVFFETLAEREPVVLHICCVETLNFGGDSWYYSLFSMEKLGTNVPGETAMQPFWFLLNHFWII